MASFKQSSLSGGIISPQLRGHSDQVKYETGVRDAVNFVVTREGTLENRAGTIYVANEHGTVASKLVKFVISQALAYVLEFGWNGTNAYVRVYQNEQLLTLTGVATWSNVTAYTGGQFVIYLGVYYWSAAASTNITPGTNPLKWYALPGNVMEFTLGDVAVGDPTAPNINWLSLMTYVQINDVMTVASQAFPPFQITFLGADAQTILQWRVTTFVAATPIGPPTITTITPNGAPLVPPAAPATLTAVGGDASTSAEYTVAAYTADALGGSIGANATVGHATVADPVVLTWSAVAGVLGYAIYVTIGIGYSPILIYLAPGSATSYTDTGAVAGNPIYVTPPAPIGPTQPGYSTYDYVVTSVDEVTGVESVASVMKSVFSQAPTPPGVFATYGAPIIVRWGTVTGAASYNIYRASAASTVYGFVGSVSQSSGTVAFADYITNPDLAIQPPQEITGTNGGAIFGSTPDYPAVVGTYQQRLLFANSINQPQTVWGSRIGNYLTFTESTPIQADDALQFTLAGRQIQPVLALVDIGKLIIHTLSGEYIAQGDQSGTLLPTAINIVQQGYAGCQPVQPVSIGITDLFVQARGSILRDLAFTIQSYSYKGKDCTTFAPDLFAGRNIIAMDWQQVPNSIIWAILDDGTLLSFTYNTEHDIWSWCRHTSALGSFESVAVIPEGGEDAVYLQVLRTINGTPVRYIERMADRTGAVIQGTNGSTLNPEAIFVDSAQLYDGRNTSLVPSSVATMTLTGSGWTPTDNLTLTLSDGSNPLHFVAGDATPPSNAVVLQQVTTVTTWDADNNLIPAGTVIDSVGLLITAYTSATVVTCTANKPVPTWAQGVPLVTWGKAIHTFTATNLPNCPLIGLGDSNVIPLTTANGSGTITTQQNYLQVVLGLQIVSQMETLDLENAQGATITDKQKRVSEVTIYFYDSRGGKYGQTFDQLQTWVQRGLQNEPWGAPVALFTGPGRIPIPGNWGATGQVCVDQRLPLPLGLAAIIPTALVGN